MKAVVLAGGFGTRIQPLTSNIPKPMLPLMNQPMLELILKRLDGLGVEEISMLLYFMPERIREYFEVNWQGKASLRYVVPDADYGTAGSVRFAADSLDGTFLVMSGDLVTDIDIGAAVEFHRSRGAVATIVLTSVANPLQFGVVIADEKGRIRSFLEKPSWGEVVSDTINTGIYVLEPEILNLIPAGKAFDFSKDLFPILLKKGKPLFGHVAAGYWRDVGNPDSYRNVHRDVFAGKMKVAPRGEPVRKETGTAWLQEGASLSSGARITGTVVVGRDVRLPRGQYTDSVFGEGCEIAAGCRFERAVLWNGVNIGRGSRLVNTVVCDGSRLGEGVYIPEGAVIAADCILEDGVSVERDVLLWPGKRVEAGSVLTSNLIWGDRFKAGLFEGNRIAGHTNVEMSSGFVAKLGEAFGSVLPRTGRILVSRDSHNASRMLKRAFLGGILSTGVSVSDLRLMPMPVTRYKLTTFGEVGGVHFRQKPGDESSTEILFFDKDGFALTEDMAKGIERIFFRENFRRSHYHEVGTISELPLAADYYREGFLREIKAPLIRDRAFTVVLDLAHGATSNILPGLMASLGCDAVILNAHPDERKLAAPSTLIKGSLARVAKIVRALGADMGFYIAPTGEHLYMVDDMGRPQPSHRCLLFVLELMGRTAGRGKARAFLPVQAPHIAAGKIRKVKIEAGRILRLPPESFREFDLVAMVDGAMAFTRFQPHFDAMFSLAVILEMMAATGAKVSDVYDDLPVTHYYSRTTVCPSETKGRLMRNFREAVQEHQTSYLDGVKFHMDGSWVLLLPDLNSPRVSLVVEGTDAARARNIFNKWGRRVSRWALER
ncbi:MAG: NTP transferase domain-containing protein [bacterium]|nr:MAG: NTP transferase domain-containing protein [bacterium]